VGYTNKGTAHKVVGQALEAREAQDVDFLRQVAMDRLDAMHVALWPAAMAGDPDSLPALVVGVQRDRVGPLDAYERCPAPLGELEEAAIRPVDVEPEPLLLDDVRQGGERVDHAGVDGCPHWPRP
jgi:hypothetical protein